jgi:hypothetical protein
MYGLSINPAITPEFIEKHIDKPLKQSSSALITKSKDFVEKKWHWGSDGLSRNPSITTDFIEKHIDKKWCWNVGGLSINPPITVEFIEKHIDKKWEWGSNGLSVNPSLTIAFVEKYFDKLVFESIATNPFTFEINRWKEYKKKIYHILCKYIMIEMVNGHECIKYHITDFLI